VGLYVVVKLFQNIMKDKWMNMGYEEEELKPYVEPEPDYKDLKRIGMLSFYGPHCKQKYIEHDHLNVTI
jgi:hypothetical protein